MGTGLYSCRSFVFLRPSSEDCLQSVCSKIILTLFMDEISFRFENLSIASSVLPFLVVRTLFSSKLKVVKENREDPMFGEDILEALLLIEVFG